MQKRTPDSTSKRTASTPGARRTTALALALAGALGLGGTGCVRKMMIDGQIGATRQAATAFDTLSDYEVANSAAYAGLAQFEGMHYLAPDNEDALFMLAQSWSGAAFAFIEDQMEQAEDADGADSPLYAYQQARTRAAYDRAIHYALELLERRHAGFQGARKNDDTMKAWLRGFGKDDAPALFWAGYAWMAKTNVAKDEPAVVSDLFVGVAMMERSVALDDKYLYGSGHVTLGAYHARSPMAELDESKKEFDKALAINGGKALLTKVQLAAKYYCIKGDKPSYERLLNEVLEAGDVLPAQRLTNTVAKRRAKRYLAPARMKSMCGF
jgi:hypothetical protein